jgi:hypothetical protein
MTIGIAGRRGRPENFRRLESREAREIGMRESESGRSARRQRRWGRRPHLAVQSRTGDWGCRLWPAMGRMRGSPRTVSRANRADQWRLSRREGGSKREPVRQIAQSTAPSPSSARCANWFCCSIVSKSVTRCSEADSNQHSARRSTLPEIIERQLRTISGPPTERRLSSDESARPPRLRAVRPAPRRSRWSSHSD